MRNILNEKYFIKYKVNLDNVTLKVSILQPIQLMNSWAVKFDLVVGDSINTKITYGNDALHAVCLAILECRQILVNEKYTEKTLEDFFPLNPLINWDWKKYSIVEKYFKKLETEGRITKNSRQNSVKNVSSKKSLEDYTNVRIIEVDISRYKEISEAFIGSITTPILVDKNQWVSIVTMTSEIGKYNLEINCKDPIATFVVSYNELRTLLEKHLIKRSKNKFPVLEYYPKFLFYDANISMNEHFQHALSFKFE